MQVSVRFRRSGWTYCLAAMIAVGLACGSGGSDSGTPDTTAPTAPADLAAPVQSASHVDLTWSASTDSGGSIARYRVFRDDGTPPNLSSGTLLGQPVATAFSDSNVQGAVQYRYWVTAVDRAGNESGPSTPLVLTTPAAGGTFPIARAPSGRYAVDASGAPFPLLGRSAWFVISLPVADYRQFLGDSVTRGHTAIEMHVLDHDSRGNQPPFAGNGSLPFTARLGGGSWSGSLSYASISSEGPDFTTPNEPYWQYVDGFLADCESRGLLVLFFPAYVGFPGTDQGWLPEMVANGPTRMRAYGEWIATRYRNQRNLVWMAGGDKGGFTVAESNVEAALLDGIRSVSGKASTEFSAEWDSGSIATDQPTFGPLMTLNGVYSWSGDVAAYGRIAYAHTPVLPAFLLEGPYDQEGSDGNGVNPNAVQPVRRFAWWGWLSTIAGHVSGNGFVWPFPPSWPSHLDTQGSRDVQVLNSFIRSIRWWELIPSGLAGQRDLVPTGGGSSPSASDYVAAAATPTGDLLVAYVPPDHTGSLGVDLAAMSGASRARWLNPTTGAFSTIGTFSNSGVQSFTPPGGNGSGFSDWVLVIDKQ